MSIISLYFASFVAIVFFVYFTVPMRMRPYCLLLASLIFYACFDLINFAFLGITALTTFAASHLTYRAAQMGKEKRGKRITAAAVLLNAGLLLVVKFLGYSVSVFGLLFDVEVPEISIPAALGIAFYTMQAISYCIDVYRKKYSPECNFCKYLLYMTYFPIIMQGPISRYDQLTDQLFTPHRFSFERMKSGLSLVLWGLFQKTVIADRAAILVNQVFNHYQDYAGIEIAIAVLLYTVQLYADFSGFVDISRGLSTVLNIELVKNFNAPYFADSIKDFWRRWHISLSSWFRDYIYFPLGGSRKGIFRKYANTVVVFFASGIWHGVGLHYIVWGLLQAFFQIVGDMTYKARNKVYEKCGVNKDNFSYKFGKQLVTFALVNFSWLFFRANGLRAALHMLKSMVSVWNPWILANGTILKMGLDGKDWNILIIAVGILFVVNVLQQRFSIRKKLEEQSFWFRYLIYIAAILSILIFGLYGPGYDQSQFLYMQF